MDPFTEQSQISIEEAIVERSSLHQDRRGIMHDGAPVRFRTFNLFPKTTTPTENVHREN
jgi:hypothetical protein